MTADEYCREIESYLCRKNDGHLIRIVGPSFDRVTGWAARGIPLKVACRGIDRYFERYYTRGPRRRPVRVDFCEPDVLDTFDEWRRAVGMLVPSGSADGSGPDDSSGGGADAGRPRGDAVRARPRMSLPAHLDRVIMKLTSLRGGGDMAPALEVALERAVRELDLARAGARSLRGDARARFEERLQALDRELLAVARATCGATQLASLEAEAESDLRAFRDRMREVAYRQAVHAAVDRHLRDLVGLPALVLE